MSALGPVAGIPMAAIRQKESRAVSSPFDSIFKDLALPVIYLIEADSYNPDTGLVQTNRFSGTGFKSADTDTPADAVYDSRMDQDPRFTRAMTRQGAIGGTAIPSQGVIRLLNGDGGLDTFLDHGFDSRNVTIKMGLRGSTLAEFGVVLNATMVRAFSTEEVFEIALRDPSLKLQTEIQPILYGAAINTRTLATKIGATGVILGVLELSPMGGGNLVLSPAGTEELTLSD